MTFYVYEHVRRDSGAVFYVGKGKGRRASSRQGRNPYWCHVVEKAGGYDIRIAVRDLTEELAHLVEIERIDQLRRLGAALTNLTDGGEGMSGFKVSAETIARRVALTRGVKRPDVSARLKGIPKTAEHRRNLSAACMGRNLSEETKKKIGDAVRGKPSSMLGKTHRAESKQKIAEAQRGERNHFFGKSHTPEAIARIVDANVGRTESARTRARKSAARQGPLNPRYGVVIPPDQKARQVAALKARPRVTCPYCSKVMDEANAKRWHLENCKDKP